MPPNCPLAGRERLRGNPCWSLGRVDSWLMRSMVQGFLLSIALCKQQMPCCLRETGLCTLVGFEIEMTEQFVYIYYVAGEASLLRRMRLL